MKYQQRRKQKRTIKKTVIVTPYPAMTTTACDDSDTETMTVIKPELIKQEIVDDRASSSNGSEYGSDRSSLSSVDAGIEHFLTRRVHPRKGTSKKLFPAHASKFPTFRLFAATHHSLRINSSVWVG